MQQFFFRITGNLLRNKSQYQPNRYPYNALIPVGVKTHYILSTLANTKVFKGMRYGMRNGGIVFIFLLKYNLLDNFLYLMKPMLRYSTLKTSFETSVKRIVFKLQ